MNSPGFTAPISLAGRASVSRSTQPREPRSAVVVPTRWSWLNVWDGALAWMVERPGELAPSSENCELACGADRGACFRAEALARSVTMWRTPACCTASSYRATLHHPRLTGSEHEMVRWPEQRTRSVSGERLCLSTLIRHGVARRPSDMFSALASETCGWQGP